MEGVIRKLIEQNEIVTLPESECPEQCATKEIAVTASLAKGFIDLPEFVCDVPCVAAPQQQTALAANNFIVLPSFLCEPCDDENNGVINSTSSVISGKTILTWWEQTIAAEYNTPDMETFVFNLKQDKFFINSCHSFRSSKLVR
jgi:hypothetical protein